MDQTISWKNSKRQHLMELAKRNAPFIYTTYILPKKMQLEQEIRYLKQSYMNEKDENKKEEIKQKAIEVKDELMVYSV